MPPAVMFVFLHRGRILVAISGIGLFPQRGLLIGEAAVGRESERLEWILLLHNFCATLVLFQFFFNWILVHFFRKL